MGLAAFRDALERDVLEAAPMALGLTLRYGELTARIVEVEAYRGEDDPACHAFGRPQMKNMLLYGEPGQAYVYFNYGVHWMLNVVAHPPGRAAALLVRAAEPLTGLETMEERRPKAKSDRELLNGPGKLAAAFGITGELNGTDLLDGQGLHLELGSPTKLAVSGPRVGIAVGKGHCLPWRFVDADAIAWVSKPSPKLTQKVPS